MESEPIGEEESGRRAAGDLASVGLDLRRVERGTSSLIGLSLDLQNKESCPVE